MYFTPRASNERWNKQEIKNSNRIRIKEKIKDCKKDIIFCNEILEKKGIDENSKMFFQTELSEKNQILILLEQELQKYN
jgi:rubrerythrin